MDEMEDRVIVDWRVCGIDLGGIVRREAVLTVAWLLAVTSLFGWPWQVAVIVYGLIALLGAAGRMLPKPKTAPDNPLDIGSDDDVPDA